MEAANKALGMPDLPLYHALSEDPFYCGVRLQASGSRLQASGMGLFYIQGRAYVLPACCLFVFVHVLCLCALSFLFLS
jgi:hypothetical protein